MKAAVVSPLERTAFLAPVPIFIASASGKRDADHDQQYSTQQCSEYLRGH